MPLHMEMMHWEITSAPNLAWASAAARNSASSPSVSSLYLTKAELSGLALRSSLKQQIDAGLLVQREVGHAGDSGIEQFGDRALMHGRILPDVEPGEMEAEAIHGAAQLPQTPPRDHTGIIRNQRTVEHVEIGLEFLYAFIRRSRADRTPCRLDLQLCGSRGQSGIDSGHREAIRLATAMRRRVGRAPGERAQFLGNVGEMRRQRQFGTERVQFLQIEVEDPARLQPQRAAHDIGGDERVAVAVAADPASHGEKGRQFAGLATLLLVQPVFERAMQPRHLVQERVIIERKAVGDFVEHGELGPAQQIGLPERQHGAAQLFVAGFGLFRRKLHPFAPVE